MYINLRGHISYELVEDIVYWVNHNSKTHSNLMYFTR